MCGRYSEQAKCVMVPNRSQGNNASCKQNTFLRVRGKELFKMRRVFLVLQLNEWVNKWMNERSLNKYGQTLTPWVGGIVRGAAEVEKETVNQRREQHMLMMRTPQERFQYFMCPRFHHHPPPTTTHTPPTPRDQKMAEEQGQRDGGKRKNKRAI